MIRPITWLLTSTTYGTWLPGDERGFVGRVTDRRTDEVEQRTRIEHDQPGTEYDRDIPALRRSAENLMNGPPVWLNVDHAKVVLAQFRETEQYRGWEILAAAVMANHFHLVVGAPDTVSSDTLLRDFKSYASRALNKRWPRPQSGTWWTQSGSRRSLPDERAVENAVRYVLNQERPLAVYSKFDPTERGTLAPRVREHSEG